MYNNTYIKMGKHARIAHLAFNGAMIDALSPYSEYVTKLRKIAEIALTNTTQHYNFVCQGFDNIALKVNLYAALRMNVELAVVWFEGSWPLSEEFEEELLKTVDEEWSETEWLSAGHIMNRRPNTDAPHFDSQCVVINLKSWAKCGHPDIVLSWSKSKFPAYVASETHIHDDYTPMYIAPAEGEQALDDLSHEGNVLDALIPIGLMNGMYTHNFPYEVRNEKYCCYPEDDLEETMEWLLDYDLHKKSKFDMYNIVDKIDDDKEELFGYKMMDKVVLYITNTESVPTRGGETADFDTMTCPCSGLHQFMHMINARKTLKRVLWTDFSDAGLFWTQFLIENWDGKNFKEFYQEHKQKIHDQFDIHDDTIIYEEELVDDFFEEVGDHWEDDWNYIRSLKHTFMKINLITEWDRLVKAIGTDHKVFIQISNIWQYEINYVNTPYFQAQAAYINLVNELLKNNEDLYITGDTPSGVFLSYQNMKEVTEIR